MPGILRIVNVTSSITFFWMLSTSSLSAADITLAAANSTCNAIKQASAQFSDRHQIEVNAICKSSGRLAKGLRGGAISANIYISANKQWMDHMIKGKLIDPSQVVSPWSNKLVVAARKEQQIELAGLETLATDEVKTILIGDPGTAPFGRYAKQALQSSGLWERVRHKIETRKHITLLAQSMEMAPQGTVGILFSTNLTPRLETIHEINPERHDPILYFMAPLSDSTSDDVIKMMDYLQGETAQRIFSGMGFRIVEPQPMRTNNDRPF